MMQRSARATAPKLGTVKSVSRSSPPRRLDCVAYYSSFTSKSLYSANSSSSSSGRSYPSSLRLNAHIYNPIVSSSARYFSTTQKMSRTETDAFGEIYVPSDRYWGAQTERSLENFRINQPQDRMPPPIIRAFGILKGAAATVNMTFGLGAPFHEHYTDVC